MQLSVCFIFHFLAKFTWSIIHKNAHITWIMHGHYLENKKHDCNSIETRLLLLSHSLVICNAKVSYLLWDSTQMLIHRRLAAHIDRHHWWQNQSFNGVQFLQPESFLVLFLSSDFDKFDLAASSRKHLDQSLEREKYWCLQCTALKVEFVTNLKLAMLWVTRAAFSASNQLF